MSSDAYVFDALRTPRGKGRPTGALYGVKPVTLAANLLRELTVRHPHFDPAAVDDIVLGIVTPIGDQGAVLPKTAAMMANWPPHVGGLQINRYCGSGLESVNIAAQKVRSGWDQLVVAGGVESMSRVPLGTDGGAWVNDPETNHDTSFIPQGVAADLIATLEGFDRETVDAYAVESQRRAAHAWDNEYFSTSVVPVRDRNGTMILDQDEHMRPTTTLDSLGTLPSPFGPMGETGFDAVALQKYHWIERIDHVHHAGNSSGIVDGASVVLVGNKRIGTTLGLRPRARIVATATSGADQTIMLTGPIPATRKLLATAGLTVDDIDLFEVNEAFASIPLMYGKELGISLDKINVNGGAIAMGHPLGATGGMLVGTALDELERTGGRRAVITLCIGAGMGVATLIERV
ncbi:acetyl-CoA C-acetyltransferase [Gordonia polyisoprenivorans]|uniref:acetyl-CoA C-acetyltransferase n=1 Tax=Gordonia polyisoprenivorans TaxID=84595 RepID=UPI001AD6D5D4|nr:acetyl-CoA C-acetyltransferase [Gordonia polyisoprenivorans]QTI69004.1 acetyl-CoA C-acetyltransferase [Gordonia polyisoprenivorans]